MADGFESDVWTEIAAKGNEAMYRNAIEGIGAMPPKGGRTSLSDAEVMASVDHMVKASQ